VIPPTFVTHFRKKYIFSNTGLEMASSFDHPTLVSYYRENVISRLLTNGSIGMATRHLETVN